MANKILTLEGTCFRNFSNNKPMHDKKSLYKELNIPLIFKLKILIFLSTIEIRHLRREYNVKLYCFNFKKLYISHDKPKRV